MRNVFGVTAVMLASLVMALPAAAGGSWLATVEDSYDPGDEVTAVGYVGAAISDAVFIARLNLVPTPMSGEASAPVWHELGPVTMETTGLSGYLTTRVSISFALPEDIQTGSYMVEVHDESGGFFGDLIGASVMVGLEPAEPRWIEWPLNEPLIAELPAQAIIAGPGFGIPVAEVRAGEYPPGAEAFMLHPEAALDETSSTSTAQSPAAPHRSFIIEGPPARDSAVGGDERDGTAPPTQAATADQDEQTADEAPAVAAPLPRSVPEDNEPADASSPDVTWLIGGAVLVLLVVVVSVTRRRHRRQVTGEVNDPVDRVLVSR